MIRKLQDATRNRGQAPTPAQPVTDGDGPSVAAQTCASPSALQPSSTDFHPLFSHAVQVQC
eukprot:4077130-Heterocapsa_arctica.AAC.1